MKFELGKFYKHTTGRTLSIVGLAETTMWGRTFVGEEIKNEGMSILIAVGNCEDNAVNYIEITKEEWMKNFVN